MHSSTQGLGYLIVFGVKGTQRNVDSDVYDTAYVVENGKMVIQTDLDSNGYRLLGSIYYVQGILNTKNSKTFLLNGCDKIIIPNGSHILKIKAMYFKLNLSYPAISLKINHGFMLNQIYNVTSSQTTQLQTINTNLKLQFGHMSMDLVNNIGNEEILLFIEYRTP